MRLFPAVGRRKGEAQRKPSAIGVVRAPPGARAAVAQADSRVALACSASGAAFPEFGTTRIGLVLEVKRTNFREFHKYKKRGEHHA